MEGQGRVEQLLEALQQPDTEKVTEATKILSSEFSTEPTALLILLKILTTESKPTGVRQLAAVEARKRVANLWPEVDDSNKPAIRNKILEFAISHESKTLRHATAQIIAEVGALDLAEGEWTELPANLIQAAGSNNALHREMALYILLILVEESPELFTEDVDKVIAILPTTIQDSQSADVRLNALALFAAFAPVIEVDEHPDLIAVIQDCVPHMVNVLKDAIASEEEERAMKSFEAFQLILEGSPSYFQKHFGDLIRFMLEVLTNKDVDEDVRLQAVNFLAECVAIRKMKVQALKIGEEIALKALSVVVELDDFDDEGERNPASQSLALLDLLASSLPPSQVVLPLLQAVGQYSVDSNPSVRRAGILALSMCVEGAPDFFSTQLKDITPLVLKLLSDPEVIVRGAALKAVARLAEDLSEDIGVLHETIIPAVIQNFDLAIEQLPNARDKAHADLKQIVLDACIAIDAIMAGMEKEATANYINDLVPRLSKLLAQDDFKLKVVALNALGAVAESAEDGFQPFFEDAVRGLGGYMEIKETAEDLDLRRAATDALGKIALAVGAEPFKPYVERLMQASEESLHLDSGNLKEQSYILWSQLSKLYKEDFEPFLEGVVKGLLASLEQDEETAMSEEAEETIKKIIAAMDKKGNNPQKDIDDILESTDLETGEMVEDVEDLDLDASPVSAIAMEKEIALEAIGDVLSHTGKKYLPYFEKTIEVVLKLVHHSYAGIISSALGTLWRAYGTVWTLQTELGMEKWQPGLPLKVEPSNELKKLGDLAMKATLGAWEDQDERNTVSDINRVLGDTLVMCGPAPLVGDNVVTEICKQLLNVITKKHVCQVDFFDDDEEDHGLSESSEYDWLVIETAMDCLVGLAKALGPQFAELWKMFEKPVLKYASATDSNERSVATGTTAECILAMGNAVTPFTTTLLKIALHRFNDEDPVTKGNALYATGLLCQYSKDDATILKQYNGILGRLEPLLSDDTEGHLLDNAAGCVARMIIAHPDKVPLAEVLPRLVELAPAKEDWEVNGPIFQVIVKLYQSENPTIRQLTPKVKVAIEKILSEDEEHLDDETREQVNHLVEYLRNK